MNIQKMFAIVIASLLFAYSANSQCGNRYRWNPPMYQNPQPRCNSGGYYIQQEYQQPYQQMQPSVCWVHTPQGHVQVQSFTQMNYRGYNYPAWQISQMQDRDASWNQFWNAQFVQYYQPQYRVNQNYCYQQGQWQYNPYSNGYYYNPNWAVVGMAIGEIVQVIANR